MCVYALFGFGGFGALVSVSLLVSWCVWLRLVVVWLWFS